MKRSKKDRSETNLLNQGFKGLGRNKMMNVKWRTHAPGRINIKSTDEQEKDLQQREAEELGELDPKLNKKLLQWKRDRRAKHKAERRAIIEEKARKEKAELKKLKEAHEMMEKMEDLDSLTME